MGIPSYFSHFVKRHRQIIKPISEITCEINNLYLDCNGIIYEAVNIDRTNKNEDSIIKYVCDKIALHIKTLKPSNNVLIAFDGVAPIAKMNQQRNRRYLSWYQNKIIREKQHLSGEKAWDTSAITPGTLFMSKLAIAINSTFARPSDFDITKFIISCSDEVGEGEHKIFEYIRNNKEYHLESVTVIYGLDADLIMLSLNHLHICKYVYLYRETPEFIQCLDKTLSADKKYLLDISEFGKNIIDEFSSIEETGRSQSKDECNGLDNLNDLSIGLTRKNQNNKIHDYIFIFFLMGNDFLPHFPSLNIRTTGIDTLLKAYKLKFVDANKTIVEDGEIVWSRVHEYIDYLKETELGNIKHEYIIRDKLTKKLKADSLIIVENEIENKLNNSPMLYRDTERFIDPWNCGWEHRYYNKLLHASLPEVEKISKNYLEGLEWTFKYYSIGCINWRWVYNYAYPPLLTDLVKSIPQTNGATINIPKEIINKTVKPYTQLGYVLPKNSLGLIPNNIGNDLLKIRPGWYKEDCGFEWSFCKYFWESHVRLPHINFDELENTIDNL